MNRYGTVTDTPESRSGSDSANAAQDVASSGLQVIAGVPVLLSRRDVMKVLGVSESTLHRMIHDGDIKPIRFRGCVRFHPDDVKRFVRLHKDGAIL